MSRPETTGRKLSTDKESIWVDYNELVASGRATNRPGVARDIAAGFLPAPRQVGPNRIAWLRRELEETAQNLPRRFPKAHGYPAKKKAVS
jgi:hypothetical protein